jgi:hypothetical protein
MKSELMNYGLGRVGVGQLRQILLTKPTAANQFDFAVPEDESWEFVCAGVGMVTGADAGTRSVTLKCIYRGVTVWQAGCFAFGAENLDLQLYFQRNSVEVVKTDDSFVSIPVGWNYCPPGSNVQGSISVGGPDDEFLSPRLQVVSWPIAPSLL